MVTVVKARRATTVALAALGMSVGAAALPSGDVSSHVGGAPAAEARMIPLPGYWVTRVMCWGPLRYTWVCGYRGPVA